MLENCLQPRKAVLGRRKGFFLWPCHHATMPPKKTITERTREQRRRPHTKYYDLVQVLRFLCSLSIWVVWHLFTFNEHKQTPWDVCVSLSASCLLPPASCKTSGFLRLAAGYIRQIHRNNKRYSLK